MSAPAFVPHEAPAPSRTVPGAVEALQAHLLSLSHLISAIGEDAYRATPSRSSGSVGEHVRHCLDHARALVSVAAHGDLSYDSRLRGTRTETDPVLAADEIGSLCLDLQDLDTASLDRPIRLRTTTHEDGSVTRVKTTCGREVAFVLQHTIHHCAIIAILLDSMGVDVPTRFGYAPSTPSTGRELSPRELGRSLAKARPHAQ